MKILDQTRDTLADLPSFRKRIELSSIAQSFLRVLIFATVYWVAVKGSSALFGLNPLVAAWCITTFLLMPIIVRKSVKKFEKTRNGWIAATVIWGVIAFILILANDPLWVKRMISGFAVFQVLGFMFWPALLGKKRLEKMIWNPKILKKNRIFQIPVSLITLTINEVAIWTNSDWIWIIAQAACVLLIPLVLVFVANITSKHSLND